MTTTSSDAALVAGHLAGDPSALAGIYDRYADPLHDTAAAMLNDRSEAADVLHDVILIAAERLDQLRDPDRLKPWLFAILRNEVYRRTKKRRQTIATDFSGSDDGYDMADDRHLDPSVDVSDSAAGEELAELVRNAARGLDERDQLVLELSVRQGLGGQDLADALGVSANQSYTLVHRMRERIEKSLGAYVIAKAGRNDCSNLDKLLGSWDGEFTVLIRKRVARHIEACEVCDTRRNKVVPLAMFASAPVYAAPAALRDRVLKGAAAQAAAPSTAYQFTATDGFPQMVRVARRVAAWVAPTAAASLILVAGGISLWFVDRGNSEVVRGDALPSVVTEAPVPAESAITDDSTPIDPSAPTSTIAVSGASNDTIPAVSTTAPITIPVGGVPPKSQPTTISPTTQAPATTAAPRPTVAPPVAPPPAAPAPQPTPPPAPQPTTPAPTTTATPAPPTTPPPAAPGQLAVSSGSIDLGASSSAGSVTISNTGDLPIDFNVGGDPGPFTVSPSSGTLAGGASVQFNATIDRAGQGEGDKIGSVQISGGGQSFSVAMSARVERDPVISGSNGGGTCVNVPTGAGGQVDLFGSATISDESSFSASISFSGPSGQSASSSMSFDAGMWFGSASVGYSANDPGSVQGSWSYTVTATDARGNSSSRSGNFTASSC